jgi:hypothetical protein
VVAFVVWVAFKTWPTQTAVGLAVGLPAYAGLYLWSLHRRPWRRCPRCRGGNQRDRRGPFRAFHSHCSRCGSTGELPRAGARLLGTWHD